MTHNGQPQTRPPHGARTTFIDAVETLKNASEIFGGNAYTRIDDIEPQARRFNARKDAHFAAFRRVFYSIIQQVDQSLFN